MLISCSVYQDGRKLADIGTHEIHEYLKRPGCFVWVALRDADAATLEEMRQEFGLHPLAVEDAHNGGQRPKVEEYDNSLFAVLHMLETVGDEIHEGQLHVFAGSNYVLTVRSHAERGLQEVRARSEREPELLRNGPGFVLYALMDAVVDRYFPVLHRLEAELETIEDGLFASDTSPRANIEALYGLKRKLATLKHAVGPLPEAVGKLYGGRVPPMVTGMEPYFRDVADHLSRLNQAVDALRDTVSTALAVNLSLISLQENETVKRLAAYAALIAVPTLIAGIYGMNFEHMPELASRYGYPLTLGIMAVLDAVIFYRLRRRGWI